MVGMAACIETDNNDVVMVVSCIQASAPQLDDDIPGIQWKLDKTHYYAGTAVLTLNTFVYEKSAKPWKTNSACAVSRTFSSTTSDCRAALQRRLVRLFVTRQHHGQNS